MFRKFRKIFALPAIVSPQFARKGSNVSAINAPSFVECLNATFRENAVRAKREKENEQKFNATS